MTTRTSSFSARLLILVLALSASTMTHAQQTLGALTGVVTDAAGAVIPGTTVTAIGEQTGLKRVQTTGSNGVYNLPDLPIGTYALTFSHDGFQQAKFPGIPVQGDRTATINATLPVGSTSDSVSVDAVPLMNAVDTTNGYVMDTAQIEAIPLPTGSFTGAAILTPGVNAELSGGTGANSGLGNAPIWANGQRDSSNSFLLNGVDASNLFNGKSTSQSGGARIVNNTGNGNSGAGGVEQSEVSIYLAIGNALPTPAPETIEELRVNASMYDAQQGSTSGAHIDVSTATGTNTIHGQMYLHHGSDWLNAAPFFFKNDNNVPASDKVPELHRYTLGGSLGGPIIKDKLFGYIAYQHLHVSDQEVGDSFLIVPSGLDNTAATRNGAGLLGIAGLPTGTAISPVASYLLNAKVNGQYLIPGETPGAMPTAKHPDNAFIPGRAYFISDQAVANIDYNATAKDTLALKYYFQHDPTTAPYGFSNVSGFSTHVDAGSHVFTVQNTYLVRSNLSTTQTLGFDRMKAYATIDQPFGPADAGISTFGSTFFPGITIIGVQNVSGVAQGLNIGEGSGSQGANTGLFQNRIMPSGNALLTLGKHSISFGGNYSYTQLNIRDERTGKGMITSQNFPGFVQGQLAQQNASFTTTTFLVGNANRYYRANQVGGYVQDKFQVTPTLSLTAGVRYDWDAGLTEKNGNIFNFDPTKYQFNTACLTNGDDNPADCYPSNGIVIAGNNPQHTPGASNTTLTGRQWGFGPRLGFAFSPKRDHGSFVIRGGTGLYYDRGENFSFFSAGYATGEVTGGPFGVVQSPPFVNAVQCSQDGPTPGANCAGPYNLSTPFGAATVIKQPTGKASDFTNYLQTPDQIHTLGQTYGPAPMTTFTDYAQDNKLPYTINYTLDFQWQPRNNLVLEMGYVGNVGRHQVVPIPVNQAQIATPDKPVNGQYYSYGNEVQTAGNYYCYGPCSPATVPGIPSKGVAPETYQSEYEGGNIDLRVPYLGYAAESETYKAAGVSAYNALQLHAQQRFSHGFSASAAYTWSHALDEQSDIGLFYTGNNALNLRSGYGSSDFDRTHVFNTNLSYQLPSPYSENSLAGKFTAGWTLNSIITLQSGQPYSVIDFSGAVGGLYFSTFDGITNPVVPLAPGKTPQSAKTGASGAFGKAALDPTAFAVPLITGSTVTAADTAAYGIPGPAPDGTAPNGDIYETNFTTGQRNIFRQSSQKRGDVELVKVAKFRDRYTLKYTLDVFNVTNHASFDVPNAEVTQNSGYNPAPAADQPAYDPSNANSFYTPPSNVGFVQHTIGAPRQIQMSLSLKF
jgi:hypothetical protein